MVGLVGLYGPMAGLVGLYNPMVGLLRLMVQWSAWFV